MADGNIFDLERKEFNTVLDRQRRLGKTDPQFLGQQQHRKAVEAQSKASIANSKIEAGWRKGQNAIGKGQLRVAQIQTGMRLVDWMKPFIIGFIILLFVIGPGLAAVSAILSAMNLWLWGGAIIIGIIIWRNL